MSPNLYASAKTHIKLTTVSNNLIQNQITMRKTRLLLSVVLLTIGISATKAAPEVETVTIGSTGYATYCSSNALYIDGVPEPIGRWTFDDGTTGTLTKTSGVTVAGGIATVPAGDNLKAIHGITDRGNYTFMMDVKIVNEEKSNYTSLFMSGDGREDGGLFFFHDSQNGTRKIGINLGHMGYDGSYELNTWYRVVFSCKDYIPTVYVDGEKVVAATQAVNPTRLHWTLGDVIYFFADNDGKEENEVQTSEIRLWDVALDEYQVAKIKFPEALGVWTFDDASNPYAGTGTATLAQWGNNSSFADGVATVLKGGGFTLDTHLSQVSNAYTFMFDVSFPDVSGFNCLFQNDVNFTSEKDGSFFIKNGQVGFGSAGLGYNGTINANTWYRIVVVINDSRCTVYVDGVKVGGPTSSQDVTAWAMRDTKQFLLFVDNDGEEKEVRASEVRFWNKALSAAQVAELATVGTTIDDGQAGSGEPPVAYTGKIVSGGLSLTELSGGIPANTAVVLKGTPNTVYRFVVMPTGLPAVTNNDLQGSDGTVTGDGSTIFALSSKANGVGFYPVGSGVTIPAGRAYLVYNNTGGNHVKGFTFVFDDDDATGISLTEDGRSQMEDGAIYNLAGQRVSKMQKGINIVNGKKVLK